MSSNPTRLRSQCDVYEVHQAQKGKSFLGRRRVCCAEKEVADCKKKGCLPSRHPFEKFIQQYAEDEW